MLTPTVQEPGTMRCSMQSSKQADSPGPGIRRPLPQFRGRYSRPWQWSPVGTMPATFVRRPWAPRLDSASCHGRISAIRSRIWQRICRWHRPPFPTNPQPIGIPCGRMPARRFFRVAYVSTGNLSACRASHARRMTNRLLGRLRVCHLKNCEPYADYQRVPATCEAAWNTYSPSLQHDTPAMRAASTAFFQVTPRARDLRRRIGAIKITIPLRKGIEHDSTCMEHQRG